MNSRPIALATRKGAGVTQNARPAQARWRSDQSWTFASNNSDPYSFHFN